MSNKKRFPRELACNSIYNLIDPLRIFLRYDGLGDDVLREKLLRKVITWEDASFEENSRNDGRMTVHNLRSHLFDLEKCAFEEEWVAAKDVLAKLSMPMAPASQLTHTQMAEMDDDDLVDAIFAEAEPDEISESFDKIVMDERAAEAASVLPVDSTRREKTSGGCSADHDAAWPGSRCLTGEIIGGPVSMAPSAPGSVVGPGPDGCMIIVGSPGVTAATVAAIRSALHALGWSIGADADGPVGMAPSAPSSVVGSGPDGCVGSPGVTAAPTAWPVPRHPTSEVIGEPLSIAAREVTPKRFAH